MFEVYKIQIDNSKDNNALEPTTSEELYKNKEWLEHKIKIEKLTLKQISDIFDVTPSAVSYWIRKFGLVQQLQSPSGERIVVHCSWCKKELKVHPCKAKRNQHFYCNKECRKQFIIRENSPHWQGGSIEVNCTYCGNKLEIKKCYLHKEHHFCNPTCMGKWYSDHRVGDKASGWNGGNIFTKCDWCGKYFERTKSQIERPKLNFCSKRCFHNHMSEIVGIDHPLYKERVPLTCIECGKVFYVQPKLTNKQSNRYRKFCSIRCSTIFWLNKPKDGWQKRCTKLFNKILKNYICEQEKTFDWLISNKGFNLRVDNYYEQLNLCIEFDGPQHYKAMSFSNQISDGECFEIIKNRDQIKNELIPAHGLKLLRFRYDEPLTEEHVLSRLAEVDIFSDLPNLETCAYN